MVNTKLRNRALLAWYDRHRRHLPWRAEKGEASDPYRVWLSEIMLQQTTVTAVGPYFTRFLTRFPTLESLAAADQDDVLAAWSGLGYYARGRNLHACAKVIVSAHDGRFPSDIDTLLELPGIGRYTAAAIAAIAFDKPALPVDGNVERVLARVYGVEDPLPGAKPTLMKLAETHVQETRPGDLAQALMDLGATICTPKSPRCMLCPWQSDCVAQARGLADVLPRREAKKDKPLRRGIAFFVERSDGAVLFRKRVEKGLLGGMWEIPSTPWTEDENAQSEAKKHAPLSARWSRVPGLVRHSFTHFNLELEIWRGAVPAKAQAEGRFLLRPEWAEIALPNVMKKVVAHGLREGRPPVSASQL